jgi:hypothetical protein
MRLVALLVLLQVSGIQFLVGSARAQARPPRRVAPVLAFPDPALDDTAAYQGYSTRLFRDAADNTVQIYIDNRSGRVVHLLADGENESVGFTVRDARGRPANVTWSGSTATVSGVSRTRTFTYDLQADASRVAIGWFLLGSMRVERDFQYAGRHTKPFAAPPFVLPEMERLVSALTFLDEPTRRQHLGFINAASVQAVRARLEPTITAGPSGTAWVARIIQPSLDARDTLAVVLRVDPARVSAARSGDSITFAARSGNTVPFSVSISTTGRALTPLTRDEIFNTAFLRFLAEAERDSASTRARWLERQVRGVQLLSSHEKLMAGLPAYATYFGRDMLVSALMMRPIWRQEMSAFVIASVLRKLGPNGDVSHEEALGGQADREAADEYARLIDAYRRATAAGARRSADSLLARSAIVLRDHRRVRENYHMIDDEFQLPVLEARWLADSTVAPQRKRAFLLDASDGEPRVRRVLRELSLVSRWTSPYVSSPIATNLVSFAHRDDSTWQSASWRDSGEGYAGGRFAMDVNAVWAPHALAAIETIFAALPRVGISLDSLARTLPELAPGTPLGNYARNPGALRHAVAVWSAASRHFVVALGPVEVQSRVRARLAALPDSERQHWAAVIATTHADRDSIIFLALSLDAQGNPIAVANTDVATRLFLADAATDTAVAALLRDVRLFTRSYPVGLFIEGVGPVVANDAYAPSSVWPQFERDQYHGPRVVWGREVNLFLLGVANHLASGRTAASAADLRDALSRIRSAVQASGFHSELWSYAVHPDRVVPIRYGTGSDVQLWSTTDLAVEYALARLSRR